MPAAKARGNQRRPPVDAGKAADGVLGAVGNCDDRHTHHRQVIIKIIDNQRGFRHSRNVDLIRFFQLSDNFQKVIGIIALDRFFQNEDIGAHGPAGEVIIEWKMELLGGGAIAAGQPVLFPGCLHHFRESGKAQVLGKPDYGGAGRVRAPGQLLSRQHRRFGEMIDEVTGDRLA